MTRLRPLAALLLAALGAAGCGAGAGETPDDVRLTVTRDFGTRDVARAVRPEVTGSDTVMRLLQRNAKVTTRYGGGFVQAIEGVAGGRRAGRPVDWFFYVNGLLEDEGAAAVDVRAGDRVWWDHHDWGLTSDVPAVVGSYPAPFTAGLDGKRLPVRLECIEPAAAACDIAAERLGKTGIVVGRGQLNAGENAETLRIVLGPWSALRDRDEAAERVDGGPRTSGVYARFDRSGRALTVLDPRGRPARRLGPGTGLVAATRIADRRPVWFVTGTDDAGVESAARALDESALGEKFALAVSADRGVPVPLVEQEGAR